MTVYLVNPISRRDFFSPVDGKRLPEVVSRWERLQGAKTVKRTGSLGLVAISLSACKSSSSNDDDTPDPVETVPVVSLFLDTETGRYAFESDVENIVNVDNSQPRLLIDEGAVGATDSYEIVLTASGTGTLVFSYEEAIDTVTLLDGSVLAGFDTLEVQSGTLDITQADVPDGLSVIKVNSGIVLTVDQFAELDEIRSESGNGEVTIQVDSQDEADQLRQLLDDGAVSLIGIKPAVASSDPDVDTDALEQQVEESVQEPVTRPEELPAGAIVSIEEQDGQLTSQSHDTIQAAINQAGAGATIYIGSGTYVEELTVNKALSFVGLAGGDDVVISSSAGTAVNVTGDINGDITFDGIDLVNGGSAARGISIDDESVAGLQAFVFEDGTIQGFGDYGIFVSDGYDEAGAPAIVDALTFRSVDMAGNGSADNPDAHIKLFGFSGSATFEDVTITGGEAGSPQNKAIEIIGALTDDGNANTFTVDTVLPEADITFIDVSVDGLFARNPVGIFNFDNVEGLQITGLDLSQATSNWSLFNIDGISTGSVEGSSYGILVPDLGTYTGGDKLLELQGPKDGQFDEGDPGVSLTGFDVDSSGGFYVLMRGGDGDDTLTSGLADDVMSAGAGADTFRFTGDSIGADVIWDFTESDGDLIDLTSYGIEISDLSFQDSDNGTTITADAFDGSIQVVGLSQDDLLSTDAIAV